MNEKRNIIALPETRTADLCSLLKSGILPQWEYLMYLYREEFIKIHPKFGWMLASKGVQLTIKHGWANNGDTGMWKV